MAYKAVQAGDRVGEFVLEEMLWEGEDRQVWRAGHHLLGSSAALKVARSETAATTIQASGIAQHRVRHPRVVRVLGLDPDHDPPYLVTEYLEKGSLRTQLDAGGPLSWGGLEPLLHDALEGLEAVHRSGRVHGNLKPSNILIDGRGRARLTDLGAREAKAEEDDLLSGVFGDKEEASGSGAGGSDPYRAPEAKAGSEPTAKADIWAMGLILFEALTGETPAGSETLSERVPGLLPQVDRAFRRAYTRPERRFASATEFSAALFAPPEDAPPIRIVSAGARCRSCGHVNRVEYRYCIRCGAPLGGPSRRPETSRCLSCGKPRYREYRFCPWCGVRYGGRGKG